jgi:hypothetical protein
MKLLLKLGDKTLGYAETDRTLTDPPMGCGEAPFLPSTDYVNAGGLFRSRSLCLGLVGDRDQVKLDIIDRELSELGLVFAVETGELLDVAGVTVYDFRPEFPEEGLRLEFLGMHHEQFERFFPGHYEKYEASFAAKA